MQRLAAVLSVFTIVAISADTARAQKAIAPDRTIEVDLPAKGIGIGGLTFDGKTLWISAQSVQMPDRLLQYSTDGKLLKSISLGRAGNVGGGLAHHQGRVHVLDYATKYSGEGAIFRLGPKDELDRFVEFPEGQFNTFGLASHGTALYYAHCPTVRPRAMLYRVEAEGAIAEAATLNLYVRGLASDGKSLWVASGKQLHRLDDQFRVIESLTTNFEVGEIAYGEGHLWAIERNTRRVHRLAGGAIRR